MFAAQDHQAGPLWIYPADLSTKAFLLKTSGGLSVNKLQHMLLPELVSFTQLALNACCATKTLPAPKTAPAKAAHHRALVIPPSPSPWSSMTLALDSSSAAPAADKLEWSPSFVLSVLPVGGAGIFDALYRLSTAIGKVLEAATRCCPCSRYCP